MLLYTVLIPRHIYINDKTCRSLRFPKRYCAGAVMNEYVDNKNLIGFDGFEYTGCGKPIIIKKTTIKRGGGHLGQSVVISYRRKDYLTVTPRACCKAECGGVGPLVKMVFPIPDNEVQRVSEFLQRHALFYKFEVAN